MRWFKHMTDSSDDEFMSELESEFGLEGYARWWKLLEAIGRQMDKSECAAVAYPWDKWQTILKGKRKKLETFLIHLQNKGKIKQKLNGNILEIECPNILKFRDEYTKKSGQSPDKVRPKKQTTEVQSTDTVVVDDAGAHAQEENSDEQADTLPPIPEKPSRVEFSNFMQRRGFDPARCREQKAMVMYGEWVERGVTLATLKRACELAEADTPLEEITSPLYYRTFVLKAEREQKQTKKRNTVRGVDVHGGFKERDYAADATPVSDIPWFNEHED